MFVNRRLSLYREQRSTIMLRSLKFPTSQMDCIKLQASSAVALELLQAADGKDKFAQSEAHIESIFKLAGILIHNELYEQFETENYNILLYLNWQQLSNIDVETRDKIRNFLDRNQSIVRYQRHEVKIFPALRSMIARFVNDVGSGVANLNVFETFSDISNKQESDLFETILEAIETFKEIKAKSTFSNAELEARKLLNTIDDYDLIIVHNSFLSKHPEYFYMTAPNNIIDQLRLI